MLTQYTGMSKCPIANIIHVVQDQLILTGVTLKLNLYPINSTITALVLENFSLKLAI